jgi:N-acetylneuraminate synthase/N,N'-diacetyllegionaminate synthase
MSLLPETGTYVIVEGGVTNYGDPELARRQVDAAAEAKADAVKFQAWKTEELVSAKVAARLKDELGGRDWFGRMKERELDRDVLAELMSYARERGLDCSATPHDVDSLEYLVGELDVPWLKVGSGESSNWEFLEHVGRAGKPVFVSFGLQDVEQAQRAVETLERAGAPEVIPLHCVSVYPTPPSLVALDRIRELTAELGRPVGISDHSVGRHVVLAAVALGARVVEKHLTFDKTDPRSLDNPGALEPDELVALVSEIRELEQALGPAPEAELREALGTAGDWALQSLVAARDLPAGTRITSADLGAKRPARGGIRPSERDAVIGRVLARDVEADEQIRPADLV